MTTSERLCDIFTIRFLVVMIITGFFTWGVIIGFAFVWMLNLLS